MTDEELRLKCLELSLKCFSLFGDNTRGIKGTPLHLASLMYKFIKTGESKSEEPYYPQPL